MGSVLGLRPVLVTTLRPVPRGTNGGVSWPGLVASVGGGLFVGVVYYITQIILLTDNQYSQNARLTPQWFVLPLCAIGGLLGSLIDSILGATLQYSGYNSVTGCITHNPNEDDIKHISGRDVLSNSSVNLISSCATGILIPILASLLS